MNNLPNALEKLLFLFVKKMLASANFLAVNFLLSRAVLVETGTIFLTEERKLTR